VKSNHGTGRRETDLEHHLHPLTDIFDSFLGPLVDAHPLEERDERRHEIVGREDARK
jgi:hypothetical protein